MTVCHVPFCSLFYIYLNTYLVWSYLGNFLFLEVWKLGSGEKVWKSEMFIELSSCVDFVLSCTDRAITEETPTPSTASVQK